MMVMTIGGDDADSLVENMNMGGASVIKLQGSEDSQVMVEAGLVFAEEAGKFKITHLLPMAPPEISGNIEENWNIVSIQGEEAVSADQIMKVFENIKAGEKVIMAFEKDGDEKEISFKKPDMGKQIRKTKVH